MSINDLFRQFFGFSTHRYPHEMPPTNDYDEHDFDSENHYPFANDVDDMFRHFEQHFQEVFRNFGFMEFSPPSLPELIPEGKIFPSFPPAEENVPLRDRFLKQPDPRPDHHQAELPVRQPEKPLFKGWFERRRPDDDALKDEDLDSAVSRNGLDGVLEINPSQASEPPTRRSSHSFFRSSVRILGTDGKVEETYTKRDSFGNEETSVMRQYGDQVHSIVTRRDHDGRQEQEEHFTNMDEQNLPEFEKRWNSSNTDSSILSSPRPPIEQQPSPGILGRFLKSFF